MMLETPRLILRPWEEADAESLYQYASAPEVGPAAGWPAHTSVADSLNVIRNILSLPETYAIVDKSTGRAVGSIGLKIGDHSSFEIPETEAEIGYWIGVPFWGQGFVPEATQEILRYAFEDLCLEKVWCGYYDGNTKSKRVQEKCGFTYRYTKQNVFCAPMHEVRTEHVSCITKEEWLERVGCS